MSEDWSSLYGDIVWAKCGTFPWWPCFVYDPVKLPSTSQKSVREKAKKLNGKQHVVYFFADSTYGYCAPKNIQPYNEETKGKFASTGKKNKEQFDNAMRIAEEQLALSKEERVSWHVVSSQEESSSEKEEDALPKAAIEGNQKKRGRPNHKKISTTKDTNDLYFKDAEYAEKDEEESIHLDDAGDEESDFGSSRVESEFEVSPITNIDDV